MLMSPNASPHIEHETGLVAHPIRRPCRLPNQVHIDHANPGNACDRVFDLCRQFTRRRAVRRRQCHGHVDRALVGDVDLVDQAEFIDVGGDFRVEHGLQRRDDLRAQPLGLFRRQRRMRLHVGGLDFSYVTHANNSPALISALTRWSTSSRVLYMPNEARQVAVTLNRSKSGITQWVPARTATPSRSITVATSCGWAPFISKEITGPLFFAVPISRSELISRRRSWA